VSERRYELDWLRVLAVLLLFIFHSARVFDTDYFYVKNAALSKGMDLIVGFISIWFMPLFFFIAGAAAYFALRRRSGKAFLAERAKRLLIPFIFGVLVLASLQVFVVYLQKPGNTVSYLSFWRYQLSVAPFTQITAGKVNDALITAYTWEPAHLWFIAYLFLFSLVSLPLFKSISDGKLSGPSERLALFCERRRSGVFLFALPMMLISLVGSVFSLSISRLFYIFAFVAGFLLYSRPGFGSALDRARRPALLSALAASTLLVIAVGVMGDTAPVWVLYGLAMWLWILALVGYARKVLNFDHRTLTYANEASYPVYILHQTVVVVLALGIVELGVPLLIKYAFLVVTAFVVTLATYEVLVRRWAPLRFLFGMRPQEVPRPASAEPPLSS
jgi:peptidoglycan/LPS O-acetylase OafA/YrhL